MIPIPEVVVPEEGRFLYRLLEGLGEGNPLSFLAVALVLGLIAYAMWRLLREELPPRGRVQWVRLISIVTAGGGAIVGLLGLVAEFSFAPSAGRHAALAGSILFFGGFLVALISLAVELSAQMREP
jgi:biotin transporter BioY